MQKPSRLLQHEYRGCGRDAHKHISVKNAYMKQEQDYNPDCKSRMCFSEELVHPAPNKYYRGSCDSARHNEELRVVLAQTPKTSLEEKRTERSMGFIADRNCEISNTP